MLTYDRTGVISYSKTTRLSHIMSIMKRDDTRECTCHYTKANKTCMPINNSLKSVIWQATNSASANNK